MQKDPDFNHHAKCEKLGITHLSFADDVLMFCRGDIKSVDMMMQVLHTFADTTGLVVNPRKCKVFFGGVDVDTRNKIKELTTYDEGPLPFRYLGVPLTTSKLNIKHYLPLIDNILAKVKHWSFKLLSMAGRIQLVQNTVIAIIQFWMQCLPIPKYVIKKIDSICRSFVWTGKATVSKKSPIAWESVCKPKNSGGMGIFNLLVWNNIALLKCLWNLCLKADNLWVKWVHIHYLKNKPILEAAISNNSSWVIKKILSLREQIPTLQPVWNQMMQKRNFKKHVYDKMMSDSDRVPWRYLLKENYARPRAIFTTWMAYHGRLSTKDRLSRFGMINDHECSLCKEEDETLDHILFTCRYSKAVWKYVMQWIDIQHEPQPWSIESRWIIQMIAKKGWRFTLLEAAVAKTVYGVWQWRNDVIFGKNTHRNTSIEIGERIIEKVMYRGWCSTKLRKHIATLMI